MILAIRLRVTVRYTEDIDPVCAATEDVCADGGHAGWDADLRQIRAICEGVIADGRAAAGNVHHRRRDALKGVVFDGMNGSGQGEVRRAKGGCGEDEGNCAVAIRCACEGKIEASERIPKILPI